MNVSRKREETSAPPQRGGDRNPGDGVNPGSKTYWRSLERLLDSPAVRPELGPEFPAGADLPPDAISRRTMMTLMGASFALAGLTACRRPVEHILPYVEAPETIVPGVPRYYATTLPLGTESYGVVVESHEGRPTKIEGNELHPSSQGAANAWLQASILGLYDPDRSRRHRRRPAADDEGGERDAAGGMQPVAWQEVKDFLIGRRNELMANGGDGLAVLMAPCASPTQARLVAALEEAMPQARLVAYEPAGDERVFAGFEQATGIACRPLYHLHKAQVVVALDADLLHTESDNLRHARGFAQARRVDGDALGMLRLYAVESTLSTTGAAADHRLRLKSGQIPAFLAALAVELKGLGLTLELPATAPSLPETARRKAGVIARDLIRAGSAGLIVAGRGQDPAVHALAYAINHALGAVGETLTLAPRIDVVASDSSALAELVTAMEEGAISTLLMLGGNPVYDAPADLGFGDALEKVEHTLHLSTHVDETSQRVGWHVSATTPFEAWGDARAADGTLSVVQPLIAPLFDGKSAIEVLGILLHGEERLGYELVRATWRELLAGGDFDSAWQRTLHDGVRPDSAPPPLAAPPVAGAAAAAFAAAGTAPPDGLELTFQLSRSLHDGRFANLAWLQELPDAMTKIVWDNALLISRATAAAQGLESGDVVRLTAGGRSLEVPVWILPGQADDSVALELGYGRTAGGRVADAAAGANAYALRTSEAPYVTAASLEKTGRRYELTQTQEHGSLEGRDLVREGSLDHYRADPGFAKDKHGPVYEQPFDDWDYDRGHQWGMAIDLNACIGCNACIVACQSENNIPVVGREQVGRGREMHWLRVDRYFSTAGDPEHAADDPEVAVQPVPCMHCENAPCEQVCPVAATVHDEEGLNAMVYNRCIGTRYCSNNCPYKVRRFNFFNYTKDTPELLKMAMNPDVTVRSRGVMEKCTYCLQRISEAKINAKLGDRPLRDGDARTACQTTCPTEAIVFGDLNDPSSAVRRRKASPRDYVMLGELNNRPRTSYQARVRNPNPAWEEA